MLTGPPPKFHGTWDIPFVNVPANPEARVLASKGVPQWFSERLDAILSTKAAGESDGFAMVTAIHDASVHLGGAMLRPCR